MYYLEKLNTFCSNENTWYCPILLLMCVNNSKPMTADRAYGAGGSMQLPAVLDTQNTVCFPVVMF